MHRHLVAAALILIASSAAAAVTNLAWHKMDWLRRPLAASPAQPRPTPPNAGDVALPETPAMAPGIIGIDEVLADLESNGARFIDAREDHEYREGHIRGAINLPSSAIYERIDDLYGAGVLAQDKVIIYCGGGDCEASHNVADELRRNFGFTHVLVYEQGWAEVESSGRFAEFIAVGDEP